MYVDLVDVDGFDQEKIFQTQDHIYEGLARLAGEMKALKAQLQELETLPRVNASTWYKGGKYLYLVHPTDRDGKRKREYVGADETAQAEALAAIRRYHEYALLKADYNDKRLDLRGYVADLEHLNLRLNGRQQRLPIGGDHG